MPRLLIESFECQSLADGRWLDVKTGDRFAFPTARGENLVLPGKPGQTPMTMVDDGLPIRIVGPIWGEGATAAARREAYAENMAALRAALTAVGTVVTITAHPPNMALATGETATIDAQFQRLLMPEPEGWEQATIAIELLCISDPPEWSVEEAS